MLPVLTLFHMKKHSIEKLVSFIIEKEVSNAQSVTQYRNPLICFTEVHNCDFFHLREKVGKHHLLPDDLLPGAQSLAAFFIPFSKQVVNANYKSEFASKEWVLAYTETNALINQICEKVMAALSQSGIEAVFIEPSNRSDRKKLTAGWSHKSMAKLTGLGSFGFNRLIITDAGCAGRFGSMLFRAKIDSKPVESKERCLYFYNGSCKLCIKRCPVNALEEDGRFDREACYQRIKQTGALFSDLQLPGACGKCSVGLPCSLNSSVKTTIK